MIETYQTQRHRDAIQKAHKERAKMFRAMGVLLITFFKLPLTLLARSESLTAMSR